MRVSMLFEISSDERAARKDNCKLPSPAAVRRKERERSGLRQSLLLRAFSISLFYAFPFLLDIGGKIGNSPAKWGQLRTDGSFFGMLEISMFSIVIKLI